MDDFFTHVTTAVFVGDRKTLDADTGVYCAVTAMGYSLKINFMYETEKR